MLTATFTHAQGIGPLTEQRLWDAGILSWSDALSAAPGDLPLTAAQRSMLLPTLHESVAALERRDYRYFAQALPAKDQWRAAPEFMDGIGFLDIETNGGFGGNAITVIGVYDNCESRIYVRDRDLEEFAQDAGRYTMWVTFFGAGFDIPLLRQRFPLLPFDQIHIDLCPVLRRIGYRGGLKSIEHQLGIQRAEQVEGLGGWDAVQLWRRWRSSRDEEALRLLIQYNREDIENLSLLLAFAYGRLRTASGYPASP